MSERASVFCRPTTWSDWQWKFCLDATDWVPTGGAENSEDWPWHDGFPGLIKRDKQHATPNAVLMPRAEGESSLEGTVMHDERAKK